VDRRSGGNAILRPARSGKADLDLVEVDLDRVRIARCCFRIEPESLPLGVFLHEADVIGAAARFA